MSLRSKIALTLFAAVAAFLGLDHLLRRASFSGAFTVLEKDRAAVELRRVEGAMRGVSTELVDSARGLAALAQGDLVGLIEGLGRIQEEPFPVLLLLDADGAVLAHRIVDPATGAPLTLRDFPNERLAPSHPVLQAWQDPDRAGAPIGLLATTRGMIALGCLEVPGPASDAPALFVVGRFLDERLVERMRAESSSAFDILLPGIGGVSAEEEALIAEAAATREPTISFDSPVALTAYGMVADIGDAPVIAVRLKLERREHALWAELEEYELLTALAVAILFPFALLLLLQGIVTGPLRKLTAHAVAIGRSDDATLRLRMQRRDEIGQLAWEFDQMLEKLEHSRVAAANNARLAGRSEIAVGVMHNVGTAVNSLNVSAVLCRNQIDSLDLEDLQAIHEQLIEHRGELDRYLDADPRGRHLLPFMEGLIERLDATAKEARREASSVTERVEQVVSLVASLQGMQSDQSVVEEVEVSDPIEAAVRLATSTNDTNCEIVVQRALDPLGPVRIDRQSLIEVLVAVLRNAFQAVAEARPEFPSVLVAARALGADEWSIDVTDNGIGIASDQLQRIFAQGVTTRPGSTGVGLHNASLAAIAMGGSLAASSAGPGMGATFTLVLPRRAAAPAESASPVAMAA